MIAEQCGVEGRVFVAFDLDFSNSCNIRRTPIQGSCDSQDKPKLMGMFQELVATLTMRNPDRELWIVGDDDRIRRRTSASH